MSPYAIVEKAVGQTPLEALENYRREAGIHASVPMAYAGRLDPMASGQLLILLGEECKKQREYHKYDKSYEFSVLFGTTSDSGDALGLLEWETPPTVTKESLTATAKKLTGELTLPYPKFSSKTVDGKPLHVWTLEGRLDEIDIPLTTTNIHQLSFMKLTEKTGAEIFDDVQTRIDSITTVTEESKKLGANFRRDDVKLAWQTWLEYHHKLPLQIATFNCVCSSGTYMRSLAEEIGRQLGTKALALSIHRDSIGRYNPLPLGIGFWSKKL